MSMSDVEERLRWAHPLSPQYAAGSMLLIEAADEIARLQSEVERLRGRCKELEADQQFAKGTLLCPEWAKSQVLIKQAEAVEDAAKEIRQDPVNSQSAWGRGWLDGRESAARMAEDYAQRLRQQAAESEGGNTP